MAMGMEKLHLIESGSVVSVILPVFVSESPFLFACLFLLS